MAPHFRNIVSACAAVETPKAAANRQDAMILVRMSRSKYPPLAKAAVVIDLALPDALRKPTTTANALIVVGLTHCGAAGKDHELDFVRLVALHLNSRTGILDVFGVDRRHRYCSVERRKQQYLYRFQLHAMLPRLIDSPALIRWIATVQVRLQLMASSCNLNFAELQRGCRACGRRRRLRAHGALTVSRDMKRKRRCKAPFPFRLEAFLGEGSTRRRLEVLLESIRLLFVGKRDIGLNCPRRIFRRMWHLTRVVPTETRSQVRCDTGVIPFGLLQTLKNIDVNHAVLWPAGPLPRAT